MSGAPDVYEELGRLSAQEWDAYKSYVPGREADRANPYIEGKSDGLEQAQRLVEFLRWRDAREEWPAEGCRCPMIVELKGGLIYLVSASVAGKFEYVRDLHGPNSHFREEVTRWHYVSGPCSCVVRVAGPEKEG